MENEVLISLPPEQSGIEVEIAKGVAQMF